jgi:hypothetical protein
LEIIAFGRKGLGFEQISKLPIIETGKTAKRRAHLAPAFVLIDQFASVSAREF